MLGVTDIVQSTGTIVNLPLTASIHDVLANVLQAVLIGVTTAVGFALRWGISRLHFGWQQALAGRVVKYAEQKFVDNTEKRQYVVNFLSSKFPRLSPDEINHMLEEAVNNLETSAAGVAAPNP